MPNIEFNIDHVAKLAMLDISDKERAMFEEQLPSIVAYVSKLQEVDTKGVDSSAYISDLHNVIRADEEVRSSDELRADIVKSFPKESGNALEVPAVFE